MNAYWKTTESTRDQETNKSGEREEQTRED